MPPFDGYRAYAIFAIVALHLIVFSGVLVDLPESREWIVRVVQATLGQAVDVLFVVSGFVVFLPTAAGTPLRPRSYAIRRAARLLPAYWAVVAILVVLALLVPFSPALPELGLSHVLLHLTMLQGPAQLFDATPIGFALDGPLWTLSVEVGFYLVLPFVAARYARRPLLGLGVAALITVIWHEAFLNVDDLARLVGAEPTPLRQLELQAASLIQLPFFAFSFAAGMTGAWAYVRWHDRAADPRLQRRAAAVQLAALLGLVAFAVLIGLQAVGSDPVIGAELARRPPALALGFSGCLAILMVAICLGPAPVQRVFGNGPARWLGDISYGVYLIHVVIITCLLRLWGGDTQPLGGPGGVLVAGDGTLRTFLVLSAVTVPAAIAYGYLSARYLERPIRSWARRHGGSAR